MKYATKFLFASTLAMASTVFAAKKSAEVKGREIVIKAEVIEGKTTWTPSKVEVKPGEKVSFKVEHNLPAGFDFHGFAIPSLNLIARVDRNKTQTFTKDIPADMKEGEYPITCQFHPAHVGATLVVRK